MFNKQWTGGPRANFVVHHRYGRDHQNLLRERKCKANRKLDPRTGIEWGRYTSFEDEDGWESIYFEKRRDAISYAKDKEYEHCHQLPRSAKEIQCDFEVFGGAGRYLELYVSDKYGNVFWDYPRTANRPITAMFISRFRWQYLLLPEYRALHS